VIPVVGWAVIRLFGLDSGYPLEALMAFTPYAGAASVAALALRRRAPAVLAAAAAISLGLVVLPRQFGDGTVSAAGRETLNVLAANVHEGGAGPAGVIRLVEELHPDIVTFEEFTPRFRREMAADGLGARLPTTSSIRAPTPGEPVSIRAIRCGDCRLPTSASGWRGPKRPCRAVVACGSSPSIHLHRPALR